MPRTLARLGWTCPALIAALDALGWDVPVVAYVAAISSGIIGYLIGRHTEPTVEPVVLAFRHGYQLRREHCDSRCTDATVIQFPRAVGQDWAGIDADATTVPLPRLPLGRRRPAPRVRHR